MAAAAVQVDPARAGSKLIYPFVGAAFQTNDHAKGAAGASAVVTLTGDAARPITIRQIDWSYDAAPGAGTTIQVKDGTTVVWEQAVTAAGPGTKTFDPPRCGTAGSNMVITLAGTGTVNCYLDVNAYVEK